MTKEDRMGDRLSSLVGVLAAGLLQVADVQAQPQPQGAFCRTPTGLTCPSNPANIGSYCRCGAAAGRIFVAPPDMSNACRTRFGTCPSGVARLGTRCRCGSDVGVISRR